MIRQLFQKPSPMMVGIDIGSHSIKAVLLSETTAGFRLEALAIVPMPKGAMSERTINDIDTIGTLITHLKTNLPKSLKYAALAVSGQSVITKIIYMLKHLTDAELESQIEIEAESLIPYPLDEVSIDFETLAINESDPSKIKVLLSVARTQCIEAKVSTLALANLNAKIVDIESYALSRAMSLYYQQLPNDAFNKRVAIIDIGAVVMLISVVQASETIYTRDHVFGGEQYTNDIINYYHMDVERAEKRKTSANENCEVLSSFKLLVVQKIRQALKVFITTSAKEQVDYIVLTGGTASINGLSDILFEELNIHTIVAEPFLGIAISSEIDSRIIARHKTQFAIATGLALRRFSPWHI